MARIAGAFATSHILMSPQGVGPRADRVVEGMREIGRLVRATKPDALVVISVDHMFNIHMGMQVPLCIGVADQWLPFGDMDIERKPFPGQRALAEHLVASAAADGFDIAKAEELEPDHGIALPLMFIDPERIIPVVPLLINVNMKPLPQPKRCYLLGRSIKSAVESFGDGAARVAVVATGGLSHWLCVPGMGTVAADFDKMVMRQIVDGNARELAKLSASEIVAQSGNGGIEIVTWLTAAATVPEQKGAAVYYEAIPEWLTGMGGLALVPAS